MSERPTNQEVCAAFRHLLTHGFHVDASMPKDVALEMTKPWRSELWEAFKEIEARMCPTPNTYRLTKDRG